jgi:photosystem II stability/assembly factor-like uncharacterized protein
MTSLQERLVYGETTTEVLASWPLLDSNRASQEDKEGMTHMKSLPRPSRTAKTSIPWALSLGFSFCLSLAAPAAHAAPTWLPLGPSGGSVDEIHVSPSSPDTLFALVQGDLFRSNDGGVRWAPTSTASDNGLRSLAVSPANPERLLAVRSSDRRVVTSRNGGRSFRPSDAGLGSIEVVSLAFDPRIPRRVYAATLFGLFRSENTGSSWRRIGTPSLPSQVSLARVVASPHDSNLLFALEQLSSPPRGGELGTLWRSTDGGRTWDAQEMSQGAAIGTNLDLPEFDPRDPHRLYLIAGSLRESTDRGATWHVIDGTRSYFSLAISAADGNFYVRLRRSGQSGFDLGVSRDRGRSFSTFSAPTPAVSTLAVSINRASVLWLGTDRGVYRSQGAAASWRASSAGIHRWVASSITAANDGGLYLGVYGEGVFHRDRDGDRWLRRSFGLGLDPQDRSALPQVTADPDDPNFAWALTRDGLFETEDRGAHWQAVETDGLTVNDAQSRFFVDPNDGARIAISPIDLDPNDVLPSILLLSENRGITWRRIEIPGSFFESLAWEVGDRQTLYAVTSAGLQRSRDGGQTWQSLESHLPNFGALSPLSSQVWSDPQRANALVVSLNNYGLYRSLDGGETFEALTTGPTGRHPTFFKVAFDPHRRDTFHTVGFVSELSLRPTLWRWSEEGGLEPTSTASDPNIDALAVDPTTVDRLYVGTREGAWRIDLDGNR